MSDLPPGWEWTTIGAVADVNPTMPKADIPDNQMVSFVPMSAVSEESGVVDHSDRRPAGGLKAKSYRQFGDHDLLVAKITPSMENGKAAVVRGLANGRGFGSTEFHVVRAASGISPHYLLHFVLQRSFRADAARNMTGTAGQLRVPTDYLRGRSLPIPPAREQERVVAAVEEHLSRLDAGVAATLSAERRIKALERAIIRQASSTIDPPRHWKVVTVADAGLVGLGLQRSPRRHSGPNMRPYLRVANVFEDRIDASDVMSMDMTDAEWERFRLRDGDVLLNEGQSPELLGRPAIYRGDPPDVAFTNSLIRFQASDAVDPEWALLVFRSHMHNRRFMRESQITTNIAHLAAGRFKTVEFPIPPLGEQRARVTEARRQMWACSRLRSEFAATRKRVAGLRRSILSAAFAGQLVPQDPDDEPASVLLERIRDQRAATTPIRRTRTRTASR